MLAGAKAAPVPGGKTAKDGGVKLMFGGQNAGGKAGLIVAFQDRHPRLTKDRACIQIGGHRMDGAPRLGVARLQGAGVGVKAGVFRQKRGVDVQHPSLEHPDKAGGQDAHETGKAEDIGLNRLDLMPECRLERRAVGKAAMIDRCDRQAKVGGLDQTQGAGIVRGHQHRPRGVIADHVTDEGEHVRPTTGDQDGDALHNRRPV